MKKVLIAEDNEHILDIFVATISGLTEREVISFNCGKDLINYVGQNHNEIGLIISDLYMKNGSGLDIFNFLYYNKINIPMAYITVEKKERIPSFEKFLQYNNKNTYFTKPISRNTLEDLFNKVFPELGIEKIHDAKSIFEYTKIAFFKLPVKIIIPVDFHLRLSDERYIILFQAKTIIEDNDYLKYKNKNITHFYIKNRDMDRYINYYLDTLNILLLSTQSNSYSSDNIMDVHLKGQDIVHRNLLSSGLNPQIIGITYKIIEKTLSLINNTGDLRTLIEKLNLKSNFFTGHSLAGNFISQMIMNELEIGNHENQLKVSMAFFFHDISLAIIDEDIQQLECELEYDVPKIKSKHHAFYCHPIESSTFLYAFKEIPSDTITIINQHHERPSGKGFPKGLWGK